MRVHQINAKTAKPYFAISFAVLGLVCFIETLWDYWFS